MLRFLVLYLALSLGANAALAADLEALKQGDMRKLVTYETPIATSEVPFVDAQGAEHSLAEYRGKVVVLNFWATWCTPCREEMPMLSELAERYRGRVQFVGIAADSLDKVRDFAHTLPVSYPLLAGGEEAIKPTKPFGNRPLAVPFTIVLDRTGALRAAALGRVTRAALVELLDQL